MPGPGHCLKEDLTMIRDWSKLTGFKNEISELPVARLKACRLAKLKQGAAFLSLSLADTAAGSVTADKSCPVLLAPSALDFKFNSALLLT